MCVAGLLTVAILLAGLPAARAVDKGLIDRTKERGVAALRKMQNPGTGRWPYLEIGATALAALTLLECQVPRDDPAIVAATRAVRSAAPESTFTYSVTLCILYLDRLGDPQDVGLIDMLVVRLLGGQNAKGGWSYNCPLGDADEMNRLRAVRQGAVKGPFPKELQDKAAKLENKRADVSAGQDDNSNTQFATLALWIARRNGWPVDDALMAVEQRFQSTQLPDGSWWYRSADLREPSASMTCAALLALAIGKGIAIERALEKGQTRPNLAKDVHLLGGLGFLANHIGEPVGDTGRPIVKPEGKWLYYLWSLERVAMILNLDRIHGKDWYNYGAEILIATQEKDGSWKVEFGESGADTCFALLFLQRANLAIDLSNKIRGKIVEIRAGPPIIKNLPGENPKKPLKEDTEEGKLAAGLVRAADADKPRVLERLRDSKGVEFTGALAVAIPHLEGEIKNEARHALTQRLTRFKAESLATYLKDVEPEIRRAAALAVGSKDSKELIPNLILLLKDPEPVVRPAAQKSLKSLTGQDLGNDLKAWQEWWNRQNK